MKKSPESIILAVALLLLALVAGYLAWSFPALEDITGVKSTTATGKTPPKLKQEELEANVAPWNTTPEWKAQPDYGNRPFISDQYLFYPSVYPDGEYIRKMGKVARTPSGVLINWYQKYQLDFTNSNVDREDPDNDGFSNLTEFKNGAAKAEECDGSKSTNPRDPTSHPSYLSRLRLDKYDSRPFHIQFRGKEQLNGVLNFQIYLKDAPSSKQPGFKKTGDPLGFEDYVIGDYHENIVTEKNANTGIESQIDKSTLELVKPKIHFKITLTYRQEIDSPESTANIVMLMPSEIGKEIKVPRGTTFTPPFMGGSEYLVIDIKDTGVVLQDTKTQQEVTIPKLDPAEWNEVPVPATPAGTSK